MGDAAESNGTSNGRKPDGTFAPGNRNGFQPGQSGNPGGRKKRVSADAIEALAGVPGVAGGGDVPSITELVHRLARAAVGLEAMTPAQIQAATWLLEHAYGKAPAKVEHSGDVGFVERLICEPMDAEVPLPIPGEHHSGAAGG